MSQNQEKLIVKIEEIKRHTKAAYKEMWVTSAIVSIVNPVPSILQNFANQKFTLSVFDRHLEYGSGHQVLQKPYPFEEGNVISISKYKIDGVNNFTFAGTFGQINLNSGDFEQYINDQPISSYNDEEVAEVRSLQNEIADLQRQMSNLQYSVQQKENTITHLNEEITTKLSRLQDANNSLSQNYEELQKIENMRFEDYIKIAQELCKRGGVEFENTSKIYIDVKEMRRNNRKNSVLFKEEN